MSKLKFFALLFAALCFYGCNEAKMTEGADDSAVEPAVTVNSDANPAVYLPTLRDKRDLASDDCLALRLTPADIASIIKTSEKSLNGTFWYKMLFAAPCTFDGFYETDGKRWRFTYHPTGFLSMSKGEGDTREEMHFICFDCPVFPGWIIQNSGQH